MNSNKVKISIGIQGFVNFYVDVDSSHTASELKEFLVNKLKQCDESYIKENIGNLYVKPEISYTSSSDGANKYYTVDELIAEFKDESE